MQVVFAELKQYLRLASPVSDASESLERAETSILMLGKKRILFDTTSASCLSADEEVSVLPHRVDEHCAPALRAQYVNCGLSNG